MSRWRFGLGLFAPLALGLALALAACAGAEGVDPTTLAAPGPYAVGYRIVDVTYTPPLGAPPRTLSVHVWYPADPSATGERPLYLLRQSEVATKDAPPLALGPRPVVVYSHGHQAYASVMSYLEEHLASHGFVVLAPTHTGNTFLDGDHRETDIYYLRALDVRATLDHFLALDPADPLAGHLDASHVAMTGHSFGGYTTFALGGARYAVDAEHAACQAGQASAAYCSTLTPEKEALFRAGLSDSRLRVLVSYDPGDFDLFGAEGVAAVDLPVLHFVAEASGYAPGAPAEDRYWSALHGARDVRLLLLGGDHNDFTDSCAAGLTVRCSTLPPAEVWAPVRAYTLAFLRRELLGEPGLDGVLRGEAGASPRFELVHR